MANDKNEQSFEEIKKRLSRCEPDQIKTDAVKNDLHEFTKLAAELGRANEQASGLASLAEILAEEEPVEAIKFAKEAMELTEDVELRECIEDALAIAYKQLGETIRCKQHRLKADDLGENTSSGNNVFGKHFFTAIRQRSTPSVDEDRFAIDLAKGAPVESWVQTKSKICLDDLDPRFANFTSNDRQFYRIATERLQMIRKRLEVGLGKPDNYLLLADPGAGKSFFVKQFCGELNRRLDGHVAFLERNLSAYSGMNQAFTDIIMDAVSALLSNRHVLLFIDEVDTQLDGEYMFQRLIAPMNGDPFFFLQKQLSFVEKNLVVFFALSRKPDEISSAQKWPDFLSRIPNNHKISLPNFSCPIERIYRAVATLPRGKFPVTKVQAAALLYIAIRPWSSSRELEQALEFAKLKSHGEEDIIKVQGEDNILELAHIASLHEDIDFVCEKMHAKFNLYSDYDSIVEIEQPKRPAIDSRR